MNIFKFLFNPEWFTFYFGGGGGPTSSYSQTSNIPEYAQPYVERMMGATEGQIYTKNDAGDITGFQPYKPFEGETVAGFSPMQKQAMSGIQNYQLPGQTQYASQMAGSAGLGSMMAGQNYAQQATNPYAMQAYMSPYMENAVAPELREAARQSAMLGQQNQAQAVQQGAFGGSRSGIVEAERQRNLGQQQADIYGKGMQNAFQSAQQAQQFGSQLGLQGYGQGLQAAGQIGQLGQQQYGQEMGLLGQQQTIGAQQQAYEQQRLNQIVQNYATQQQYPFIQLGTLSNMLRGLPMQASTTQMYQAQPTGLTAGIGLAGAGANLYQAFGKKEGGTVKAMASGGIATGVDPYKLPGMLEKLSDKQLSTKGEDQQVDPATKEMVDAETARRAGLRKGAGIMQAANGGVVAFKAGSKDAVDENKAPATNASITRDYLTGESAAAPEIAAARAERDRLAGEVASGPEAMMQRKQALYDKYGVNPAEMYEKQRQEQQSQLRMTEEDARKSEHLRYAQIFAKLGSTPGPILKAALVAINDGIPDLLDDQAKTRAAQKEIKKTLADIDRSELLYTKGNIDEADKTHQAAVARATDLNMALSKSILGQEEAKGKIAAGLEEHRITGESHERAAGITAAGHVKAAEVHGRSEDNREKARLAKEAQLEKKRADEHTRLAQAEVNKLKYDKERRKDIETAKTIVNGSGSEEEKKLWRQKLKDYKNEEDELRRRLPSLYPEARFEEIEGATPAPAVATYNYVPGKGVVPAK